MKEFVAGLTIAAIVVVACYFAIPDPRQAECDHTVELPTLAKQLELVDIDPDLIELTQTGVWKMSDRNARIAHLDTDYDVADEQVILPDLDDAARQRIFNLNGMRITVTGKEMQDADGSRFVVALKEADFGPAPPEPPPAEPTRFWVTGIGEKDGMRIKSNEGHEIDPTKLVDEDGYKTMILYASSNPKLQKNLPPRPKPTDRYMRIEYRKVVYEEVPEDLVDLLIVDPTVAYVQGAFPDCYFLVPHDHAKWPEIEAASEKFREDLGTTDPDKLKQLEEATKRPIPKA